MSDLQIHAIDAGRIRDILDLLLDTHGRLRVVPTAVLAATTAQERFVFGVRHGL